MGMTVKRNKDQRTPNVFVHKVADIRGGVSVKASELGGDWLREGAVISTPTNGVCSVVKYAEVTAAVAASGKAIKVGKFHNFKVGDFVMTAVGGLSYKITAIDSTTSKTEDTITIGTTLGAIDKGAYIMEASAESSSTTSALKYTPLAVVGTGKPIEADSNINTDAWVIGVTKSNPLPSAIASVLKGIINY